MTPTEKVIDFIRGFSLKEICEISGGEISNYIEDKSDEYTSSEEYLKIQREEENKNKSRKEIDNRLSKIQIDWLRANPLKKDTIIKVKGARDGKGYRKVIRQENDNLICMQLSRGFSSKLEETNYMTTHMLHKVRYIWKNNKWIDIKELMKK